MLRTERRSDCYVAACGQRIERVRQVCRDRGGMREQCNAPAAEGRAQGAFGDEAIDAKFHGRYVSDDLKRKAIGMMEIRFAGWMSQRPIGSIAANFLDHCCEAEPQRRAFGEQYVIQLH
jgi:hypothetical protein